MTYDNLEAGWLEMVKFGPFEKGELPDSTRLSEVFHRWNPAAVLHLSALNQVGEATRDPGKYWTCNVSGSINILNTMVGHGCKRIVFSSTCAIYGDQDGVLLQEGTPQHPDKRVWLDQRDIDNMIIDFTKSYYIESVMFRYFYVSGADPEAELGELHVPETNLIPALLEVASGERENFTIYGTDYLTPDGTCIRDYVHVSDLVDAHVLGLGWLQAGRAGRVFCLGSGQGFSVRCVIAEAQEVTGRAIHFESGPRRKGDAARLVCGSTAAMRELGWEPVRSTLSLMIEDAWRVRHVLPHPARRL